jgi:hypothetical protein
MSLNDDGVKNPDRVIVLVRFAQINI